MDELKYLTNIPEKEEKDLDDFIKISRKRFILPPKDTVINILQTHHAFISNLKYKRNVSDLIKILREEAFNLFLKKEAEMNTFILQNISEKFELPNYIFNNLVLIFQNESSKNLKEKLRNFFGNFSGHIYPYIYRLSLSNTQSRRSRAGKIFEGIIYALYESLGYAFESQATIGSGKFKSKKLGKIVDSLLPSFNAFEQRRDKVIIGTMKTTLRERWQEVVEEINRTMVPKIYLLTLDENISQLKVEQMNNHNVILVVYNHIKELDIFKNKRNIISFEDYFFDEIPVALKYWENYEF